MDSTGRHTDYTYNSAGELATAADALGKVTTYHYDDARDRTWLTSIVDPLGHTYLTNTYDAQGRIIEQLDGLTNKWTLSYGSGYTDVTAPNQQPGGPATRYAFDSSSRLASVTDALGRETSYSYDAAGNIDVVTRPGGATTQFDYSAAGNLLSSTDPLDRESTFTYDAQNHPTSFTNARGKTWTYTWTGTTATSPRSFTRGTSRPRSPMTAAAAVDNHGPK